MYPPRPRVQGPGQRPTPLEVFDVLVFGVDSNSSATGGSSDYGDYGNMA